MSMRRSRSINSANDWEANFRPDMDFVMMYYGTLDDQYVAMNSHAQRKRNQEAKLAELTEPVTPETQKPPLEDPVQVGKAESRKQKSERPRKYRGLEKARAGSDRELTSLRSEGENGEGVDGTLTWSRVGLLVMAKRRPDADTLRAMAVWEMFAEDVSGETQGYVTGWEEGSIGTVRKGRRAGWFGSLFRKD